MKIDTFPGDDVDDDIGTNEHYIFYRFQDTFTATRFISLANVKKDKTV